MRTLEHQRSMEHSIGPYRKKTCTLSDRFEKTQYEARQVLDTRSIRNCGKKLNNNNFRFRAGFDDKNSRKVGIARARKGFFKKIFRNVSGVKYQSE